jgi:hypothetical protein
MRALGCSVFLAPVGLGLALLSGCSGDNESNMAETKGVAAANAPKTQAEYYKQQQEIEKAAQGKTRAKK